jgi:hypothetical protein
VDASGNIYVVDNRNQRVLKFDPNGNFIFQAGSPGPGEGQFQSPLNLDLDGLGGFYVTDPNKHSVQKFNANGKFIYQFGGSGSGPGQFTLMQGIAVSRTGRIYVVDSGLTIPRIEVFADDLKPDKDGDALQGASDSDEDGDGIRDSAERLDVAAAEEGAELNALNEENDTDGDGIPNWRDLDSDADGICDIIEAGLPDEDSDCLVDNPEDLNGNGIADIVDESAGGVPAPLPDTDGDGLPDFLDGDSDGDGICDVSETDQGIDDNGDCVYDNEEDLDNDGLADALFVAGGEPLILTDSDGDGIPDYRDEKSSGSGGSCALAPSNTATPAALLPLLFLPALIFLRRSLRISK